MKNLCFVFIFSFLFAIILRPSDFSQKFRELRRDPECHNGRYFFDFVSHYDEIVKIKGFNNCISVYGSEQEIDIGPAFPGTTDFGFSQKYLIDPKMKSLYVNAPFSIGNGKIEFEYDVSEKDQTKNEYFLENLCFYGNHWKKDWFSVEIWSNLRAIKLVDHKSLKTVMLSGLENIQEVFIQDCQNLEKIDLQNKKNLLYFTLTNCNKVKTLLLPEQIEKIRIQNFNELLSFNNDDAVFPHVECSKLWNVGNFILSCKNFPNLKTLIIKSLVQVKNIENCTLLEKLIIKDQGNLNAIDLSGMKFLKYFEINNENSENDDLKTITFNPSQKIDSISIVNCKNIKNITLPDYAGNHCVVSNSQLSPNDQLEKILFFGHEDDSSYYPQFKEKVVLKTKDQNIYEAAKIVQVIKEGKNLYTKKSLLISLAFIALFSGFYYNKQIKALFKKYVSQRFNF